MLKEYGFEDLDLDEASINSDELLKQLCEEDNKPDPSKVTQLKSEIEEEHNLCKKFHGTGDKKTAIEHMKRKKELEKQLADYLAQFEESKSDDNEDVVEMEEKYHDSEGMCAVSVLEHEIKWLKDKVKVKSHDRDYFLTKIETLEF